MKAFPIHVSREADSKTSSRVPVQSRINVKVFHLEASVWLMYISHSPIVVNPETTPSMVMVPWVTKASGTAMRVSR